MDKNNSPNRVLLGQLISNGDCLYATAVAQQIKHDFPGCHLTWAVSSLCRKTLEENPWIDDIWEIPLANWSDELLRASWHSFANEALRRYERGLYDFVFFTQIYPGSPHHFDGTVRPGIFLGYPGKIAVPLRPSLRLRTEEVQNVKDFAEKNRLRDFEQVILFECASKSGQSHVTPEFALQSAEKIVRKSAARNAVILSSHHTVPTSLEGIIDGSVLTLREIAELTRYCTLLIGCSSGVSCVSTSTWAKPLPMIQMLSNRCAMFASLAHDYLHFGLPTSHVIEMFDADGDRLVNCVDSFFAQGREKTRALYHQDPQIAFTYYLDFARNILLNALDYYGFCISLRHVVDRYGWHSDLEATLREVAGNVLGPPAADRGISSDELLRMLAVPARALSSASSGYWGYDTSSTRPDTCLLPLRRNKFELERLLTTTYGFSKGDPACSEIIAALTDHSPKERVISLQAKSPKEQWRPLAWILALMQEAEYVAALQEILRWKKIAPSWNSELEEILSDLNWMQGYHSKALAGYHQAAQGRSDNPQLQRKIDRLMARTGVTLQLAKPEAELKHLGLAFYSVEAINKVSLEVLTKSRLQIVGVFGLETAFLTTPGNDTEPWSLVGGEGLQKAGFPNSFKYSKASPDCKEFIGAAVDWADRTGKEWVAMAPLGTIITIPFLRELHDRLADHPSALIVDRWDVFLSSDGTALNLSGKQPLAPALILMSVAWWKKNGRRFSGYRLGEADWMARYATKLQRLTKVTYLRDVEQRLVTIQTEAPVASGIRRFKHLLYLIKRDFGAMLRLKRFKLYYGRSH